MQQKILLFDFDGTIADSADAAVRVYNDIAKEYGYRMLSEDILAIIRNMSAMENIRYMGIPLIKLPIISKKVRAAFKSEVPNLNAFDGIKEALRLLKNKGHKLYILSSNSKENIEAFLEHNQITEFDGVYSESNIFGKHTKINKLIRKNNWNRSNVMYIGDEARDIEAAKKADIAVAAVAWGYNNESVLAKFEPTTILRTTAELGSI